LLRSLKFVSDAPVKNEELGYYRKIFLAQAADPKIRKQSGGGGVVTSLLTFGIENKVFDSAIVSAAEPESPLKPRASVALVPDDILSAVGTKFFPSTVAKAFGSAVHGYGKTKIAFVGVPCHVLALRKIESWQHKIGSSLKINIGLFCFGTFSMAPLLEYLEKEYKIKPSDIKKMRLSNQFVIHTKKNVIRIPIDEIRNHVMPSCQACTDFTAELADISVGTAYPLQDWSTVILRTKSGEDFFYEAVEKGVLSIQPIEAESEVFEGVLRAAMQKRTSGLRKTREFEKAYGFMPAQLLRESEALARVKVEDIMTKNVMTVPKDMTVNQLLSLMAKKHHIGYPVVDEKGEPVGLATLEEASRVEKKKRQQTRVEQVMRRNLVAAYPGETGLDVFRKMSTNETGRVVVLDRAKGNELLGIVTKIDLIDALAKLVPK
jgi:coenzyme F420 hydrogenase subunit beta